MPRVTPAICRVSRQSVKFYHLSRVSGSSVRVRGRSKAQMETLPLTDEDEDEQPPPLSSEKRRKSVFTRGYNPNDPDEILDVHPKSEEAKKKLEESVKDNLLFRGLEPEQLMAIIDAMKEVKVKKGEEIIKQGEDGDYFYVIDQGIYEVHVTKENGEDIIMQTYVGNGCFGELALMYNQPRQATVRAITDGSVYSLERDLFKKIVVRSAHVRRKLYGELIDKVSLFETLTEYEKLKIADVLYTLVFSDGDSIIKQGETADGMYFVISGSVRITKIVQGKEVPVKLINSGQYFGELALLKNKPRAASATALGSTKVAFLAAEAFERLMGPCLKMMQINAEDYL